MNKDNLDGCTCGIFDRENREHQPGCRFFNQELWDIVLNHRVQLLNADRNADLAKEADAECVAAINKTIMEEVLEILKDDELRGDAPEWLDDAENWLEPGVSPSFTYGHIRLIGNRVKAELRQAIIKKYGRADNELA